MKEKFLYIIFLLSTLSFSQQIGVSFWGDSDINQGPQQDTVQLYAILEKDFTQSGIYDNVYTDVDADVILTSPTAVVDTLPMFWDGGNTWKFRFSPNEAGTWTWRTVSADGGLNNKSGTFVCVSSSNEGSIAADATYPYHFKRQNGENFWFMGDTQWNLFRTIPYDSLNTETVKDYIDLRYAQGYNVVHFVTNTDEQWYDVDQDDPDSINLTFFQNGDERLAYLNSKGMIGGLLISWGRERGDGTWRDWDNFTTDENKIRYMRYVVARYSAYNIYWILSGEYDESLTADFDYLGEQLKRYDPHHRMIALHPGGVGSSEIYADTDWMTIADYRQTVTETEDVHATLLSSRDHNKPVVFSEYGYYMCDRDSNGQVDQIYEIMPWTRRMAWNAAMAGGYFITGYGATVLGGLRDDWAFTNMDDPKYDDWEQQVGYIKSFFEDLDYWRLTPNDALITSGSGTHHLLYEDDSVYVVYAYLEGSTFQVNLSSAAGVYAGTRLDPVTGSTVSIGNYNGGGTITVSVPDTNDYVYMFRRTSSSGYITQTDTLYINNYADDGYVISNGTFNNGSDEDGTMTFGNYTDLLYTMFLRFSNFQAPQGATITSAKIYLTANGDRTGTVCNGNIYFCDTSSSAQITSKADLDARSITSAVAWNSVPAWYDGTVNSSPELKTILQTVVDRYDWSEGNAVQIFIKDYGSSTDARRRANARTPLSNYNTAFLVVTYEYGDAPPPPPVYIDTVQLYAIPIRAFFTSFNSDDTTDENLQWIRTDFKDEGFNTLILQIDYDFDFTNYPHLRDTKYVGRPFISRLKAACDSAGITLIPHFTSFGHQGEGEDLYKLLDYYPKSFDAQPDEVGSPSDIRSWNPLNDSVVTITNDLMADIADAFGATNFSIGFDEIFMMPYTGSAYYDGEHWATIYANEQKRIINNLRNNGVDTVYMWGDRLLRNSVWSLGAYESNAQESGDKDAAAAIDSIYKDGVIIADWHYNSSPATPEYFADKGFDVVSVYWKSGAGDSWQPGLDHLQRHFDASPSRDTNMLGVMSVNWRGLTASRLAYYRAAGFSESTKEFIDNAKIVMSQWRDDDSAVYIAGEQHIEEAVYDTVLTDLDGEAVIELGVKFETTLDGQITKVRIYTGASEGGDHTITLWNTAQNAKCFQESWNITSGTEGWKEHTLSIPYSVTADSVYTLSVSTSSDYLYSKTNSYWEAPRTKNNVITYRGSGVYTYSVGTMPTSSNLSTYYRDIVFEANSEGGGGGGGTAESVYYVDDVDGNDSNDGTTELTAWKTLSKVNSISLVEGDTVLLRKDGVWHETLNITESGTESEPIVFGSYGTGNKPKISQRSELSGWDNPSNWAVFDADVYIWRFTLPSTQLSAANWTGLWLNGQYYKRAYNIYTNNFPFDSTALDYQDTDTYPGIDNNYRWFINSTCTYLYLYSVNNPATEYNMIEANIRITDPAFWHNVKGTNANYIVLDGLSFEGGYNSIYLDNCSNWKIKNCYSEFAPRALMLTGGSNNNYIHNNHFRSGQDSLANGDMAYYGSGILALFNSVYLWTSASNNIIYGNLIEDFPNGAFHFGTPSTSGSVNWNLIDSNFIKMNIRSGRFLGMYGDDGVYDYMRGNVLVRNYIENQRQGDNWVGDSTVLAFNIYNTVQPQSNPLYGAWGKVSQGGGEHSYFGNNTFYNTRYEALYPEQGYLSGYGQNNLFVNCNTQSANKYAVNMYTQSFNQHQTWNYNLLFYDGKGSSDYLVLYNGSYYTVSGWNSADAGDDVIADNFQHTGVIGDLIDTDDFTYPVGSPALNSGTDAPSWVKTKILQKFPNGFSRRDGTLIWNSGGTRVNADVGAGGK